jgi:tetratricopeptide (TPR) repeat protein
VDVAFYRILVEGIEEEERGNLVEIMASRMGKTIAKEEQERIEEIAEGHPMATYLLVSNKERVGITNLENFKRGLDFSRDTDVKEYMERVIKKSVGLKAYGLLKDLSVIEEEMDGAIMDEILRNPEEMGELFDASIMERRGDKIGWKYNQINEAVSEDTPERHRLAIEYYKKKWETHKDVKDRIEMLYHMVKKDYIREILDAFVGLASEIRMEDPVMRLLPKVGEEIKNHVIEEERRLVFGTLGNIYWSISNYKGKAENCKKAITAYGEALKVYALKDFPIDYAMTQNNLGATYKTLAEVEDKTRNCRKAITAYEEALKVRKLEDFPMDYAATQNNLGNAYSTLAEVEEKVENSKKAITAYGEALKVYTLKNFPMDYAMTQNNLGNAYKTLAEVEDKAENCKKAITAYEEALNIYTKEEFPEVYQIVERNLKILLDFCKNH